jgi:RHS repeat-associated protein
LSATYHLTCSKTGTLTCTSVTPSTLPLDPREDDQVTVRFAAGAVGSGRITLSASGGGTDTGYFLVTVQATGAPTVALRNQNGDNQDRSLCLTTGAGESAAGVCGDLVVTHALPGYATMGRERALTLLYSSGTASPQPIVTAAIGQPAGIATPSTLYVELEVAGAIRDSATYSTTGWSTGTRQVGLSYDAQGAGHATGVYPFTLRVQNRYTSGAFTTPVSGNLIVVNRYASRYGAGVGLAGVEELVINQPVSQPDGSILWVGGAGSAKLYAPIDSAGSHRWLAPAGAYRDTLTFNPATQEYTRTLRHGVQVVFNSAGRHLRTVARTTQQTSFTWNLDTLKSITVPPGGASGVTYTLAYDPATGWLDRITDPTGRVQDVTVTAGVLTSVLDPDGRSTGFAYDGNRKLTSRTSRRGFTTRYAYANNHRLTQVTVPVGRTLTDTATAVTQFTPWDERGLALGLSGQGAVDTALAYTRILGPRYPAVSDTAAFSIDRWGAPTKIVDALGRTTRVARSQAGVPALVTAVTSADNRVDSLAYDARGNLLQLQVITSGVTGSTPLPTATTRWTYTSSNTKDSPDSLIDPEGVVTRYAYDTLGLTSQVTAPNGHLTQYVTVPSGTLKGLVQAVKELSIMAWDSSQHKEIAVATARTAFAFNALGNVVADTSPTGRVRTYTRDVKQRVSDLFDAAGHRTEFTYDSLNRVVQTLQHVEQDGNPGFPHDPNFTAPLITTTTYDVDVLASVADPRGVPRNYSYDGSGRPISETDDSGHVITRWFSKAGRVDSVLSRSGLRVRHTYDAAGRQTKLIWPVVPNGTAGDSVVYAYDVMGRLITAQTSWPGAASVTRTYYGTGAVRTDVENAAQPILLVSQAYYYDRAGRRTGYRVGTPGDAVHSDSVGYTYDAASGELRQLKVWWRTVRFGAIPADSVRFRWDALGRRDTVAYSSGAVFAFGYDQDGTQRLLCSTHGSNTPAGVDMFQSRVVHDWVDQDGMIRQTNRLASVPVGCLSTNKLSGLNPINSYDNRHELTSQAQGATTTAYSYDGSGNAVQTATTSGTTVTYVDSMAPGHNQLVKRSVVGTNSIWQYRYNPDGSRFDENPCQTSCPGPQIGYRQYLYDGLDRTVGFNEWSCASGTCQLVPNSNCYYDPLGRFLASCENGAPNLGYDGDNVVRTGSDGTTGFDWTFVHGPGTDDPLLGHYPGTVNRRAFFITDGAGRQYVVADQNGTDLTADLDYTQNGGKYAGGTQNASSFGADRQGTSNAPGLSFFRNRVYDQATGRWTQEDPIGVAGGLNLYQFNGNNPVSFSDPFGLDPCKVYGNCTQSDGGSYGLVDPNTKGGLEPVDPIGTAIMLTVAPEAEGAAVAGTGAKALLTGAKYELSAGLKRVTGELTDNALRRAYTGAINQINRHKEILEKALPEQVNSIMKDIVKHEKRLQAAIEEMARRGVDP